MYSSKKNNILQTSLLVLIHMFAIASGILLRSQRELKSNKLENTLNLNKLKSYNHNNF